MGKHLEVTEQTYDRRENQFWGMIAVDAKRLKVIEREDQRLKRIVANQSADIGMFKEVNQGNF